MREERDDNPFSWYRWQYDSAGRLLVQDGSLPGQEQWRWDAAGNPLEGAAEKVTHNRLTQLNGIRWRYDIHGRTVEKDNGQTRWHYRYDGEHRLTEVISQPRDRNKPQTQVNFRYDPLGRRISKTRRQMLGGQPTGKPVTTRFVWEGFRLLQEVHGDVPLTYVYSDQDSYDPLARIDGVDAPEIFWFHCQPNGTPERMTDIEGQVRWEGVNSAWGKLYQYAPNPVGWVDPWGLKCKSTEDGPILGPHGSLKNDLRPGQSHHLNQDAAFRDIIPTNSGAAIKLEGNAFTQPGTPHYEAHKSLEQFWNQFRKGGASYREMPSNLQYTQALKHSLEAAGLPANQVKEAVRYSIQNRIEHGALGGMNVPRIPGRINQVKT